VSVVANQEAIRIGMSARNYLSGSKPRMHSFETVWWNSCSRFKHCAVHSAVGGPNNRRSGCCVELALERIADPPRLSL
jgi:hypothetical protein